MVKDFELKIYQMGGMVLFLLMIVLGYKYISLKGVYKNTESEKAVICTENRQLYREMDSLKKKNYELEVDNSRYLDEFQKIGK